MRSAYLIMAHNNFLQLRILLELLDDPNNDIYIHIDKKCTNFKLFDIILNVKYSKVKQISSINVNWGGYSIVQCELNLLEAAIPGEYDYYHLISGTDLPLYPQVCFQKFLKENQGKEFVHFASDVEKERCLIYDRVQYYHLFQENLKSQNKIKRATCIFLKNVTLTIQRIFHLKRTIKIPIQFGSQWFSITHHFANYLLENKNQIKKIFKFTRCPDELFIQTLLYISPYYHNVYDMTGELNFSGALRLINFERGNNEGNPYIFTSDDIEELFSSNCFFARKFDEKIDKEIIYTIYDRIKKNG